jgi:predicted metal-dependent hydrolase
MKQATLQTMELDGRMVDYRLIRSEAAKKLRVRVGLGGIEVVHPAKRDQKDLEEFLLTHHDWLCRQLERIERMRQVRRPSKATGPEILFHGEIMPLHIVHCEGKQTNHIINAADAITILRGTLSPTSPAASLENWLRKQAREKIHSLVSELAKRLKKQPSKIYIMGQRTKWGNCSSKHNLSFNWRLIMAPEFVIHYLVTHEVAHLEVPDHSKLFWLKVQSLCPEMERAKQWLSANSHRLMVDLGKIQQTNLHP